MSTDKELAIMRGKYAIKKSEQDGKLRIPEMKLSIANFTKDTKYISSPNGKMYEIAVDNDGQLYAKEIDKDVIFPSDMPSKFKFTLVNNLSKGEKLPFDIVLCVYVLRIAIIDVIICIASHPVEITIKRQIYPRISEAIFLA